MKPFNRWVDRFCARHPRFGVGNLIMYLVLGNLVVWLFSIMDTTNSFLYYLYFMPSQILPGADLAAGDLHFHPQQQRDTDSPVSVFLLLYRQRPGAGVGGR